MVNLLKIVSTLFVVTFFVACGGAAPQPAASLPSWYLNPKSSDTATYYSVGEGSSKEEAKLNALNSIASEISVSVASTTDSSAKSTLTNDGEKVSKEFTVNVKSSVEKIKFTAAKVIDNAYVNGVFYTYVSVDRKLLFNNLKKDMDGKFNKVTSLWKHIESAGVFELLKSKKKLEQNINQVMPQLSILRAINSSFKGDEYIKTLESIQNSAREQHSAMVVYVKSIGADPFANLIKKYISSNNMNLITSPSQAKKRSDLLIVEVSYSAKPKRVKSSDPRLKGASFADVQVTITTKNSEGKVVGKNIISVLNISKEGYSAAVMKTAKFERELKKIGILKTLTATK